MTPLDCVLTTKATVKSLGGAFMLDGATYKRGAELGFPGLSFYVAGRCGVLGRVDATVVGSAMFWFEPGLVGSSWAQGLDVMEPARAAEHFAACGYEWARTRFDHDGTSERIAELAARINDAADPAGLSLFAGWQATERPSDPSARALHEMHVLRELRGSAHGIAIVCAGLSPIEAVLAGGGEANARLFGWQPPFEKPSEGLRRSWEAAEMVTDSIVARAYAALSPSELEQFAEITATLA